MAINIGDLAAQANIADDDILHLRTAGGIDRKITGLNVAGELAGRFGIYRKVQVKTAVAAGDPISTWAGFYGKYKVEEFQGQTLAQIGTANGPRCVEVTKDYTTGKVGFVSTRGDQIRLAELDDDGEGWSWLTPETTYASVNTPATVVNSTAFGVIALPDSGGRHRFFVWWQDAAGGGDNTWMRVGEWDGSIGFTWLTAEVQMIAAPTIGDFTEGVLLEDGQHIVLAGRQTNTVRAIVVKWVSGTATLSVAVASTQVHGTTNAQNHLHAMKAIGHSGLVGIILHGGSTSAGGVWYGKILVLKFAAPSTLTVVVNRTANTGYRSIVFYENYWHGGKGGFSGEYWRTMSLQDNSSTFYTDYGHFVDGVEFYPRAAMAESYSPLGFTTKNDAVIKVYGVSYNEDDFGYMLTVFDTTVTSVSAMIGRFKGFDYLTVIPAYQLGDTGNCVVHGGDCANGLAIAKYVLNADDFQYINAIRCPVCVGVALEAGSIDDEVTVLEFGAATIADFKSWNRPLSRGVYTWDPVSGEFVRGNMGHDVQLTVLEGNIINVSKVQQGV